MPSSPDATSSSSISSGEGGSDSTIGIARMVSVSPKVSASFAGMTPAQRLVRTWENSTIIEFDSSVGAGSTRRF
jgi:hypothetical protein